MSKVNILVVDDHPEGILAVQAVLDNPEYNIVAASSGTEALRRLLDADFAVILMDVQMPIMNGFETAEVIKTREKSKHIPIVFMSAINQDEQYVYQGYSVGAVDYLLKPFDPYILRSKVSIFVEIYKKNQLIKTQTQKLHESEIKTYTQALDRLEIESLRRYKYLADSISQILFRFRHDGSSVYLNKSWFEFTGLMQEYEFNNHNWKQVIHPHDLPFFEDFFKNIVQQDTAEFECRILNYEGKFRWHLVRIAEEDGYLLGTATDIEDRKKSEDTQKFLSSAGELLVSSLDFKSSLDKILDLIVPDLADWASFVVLKDSKLEVLAMKIFDGERAEALNKLHQDYLKQEDLEQGILKVLRTGKSELYRAVGQEMVEQIIFDNQSIKVAITFSGKVALIVPMIIKGDIIGAITFVANDLGKFHEPHQIAMAEELARRSALAYENSHLYQLSQEAIEIRNDFLSIASHELNTPITSLKLQLQMVRRKLLSEATQKFDQSSFTKSIDSSVMHVDRLIKLVGVLLDVSRIQSGKFTYNFEDFNAKDAVNEILERNLDILNDSHCKVTINNVQDIQVRWDRTRFEQVLTNILNNAIKYAPGELELKVEPQGEEVVISLSDHGEGIQKDKLITIFDRFERLNSNQNVGGLGLGLYIVKQIVEGHGGSVTVESETGQGTTFIIKLPYAPPAIRSSSLPQ